MCFPFTVNYGFFSFFSFLFFLFHVVLFRRSEVYSINVMAATGGYGTHFKRTSSTFLMCGKWLAHLVLFYGGITPHVGGSCSKEFIFVKKKKKKGSAVPAAREIVVLRTRRNKNTPKI